MSARKIRLTKKIGFCFGVKRAIEMAEAALEKKGPIYSLGSIIHNSQVVADLGAKGLKVVNDIGSLKRGTVVISSHGISPGSKKRILGKGLKVIDTTCPFVLNAQRKARSLSKEGYTVVIVGDVNHPEVKALKDFAGKDSIVVKDASEARKVSFPGRQRGKVSVIAQTTQSIDNFLDVSNIILACGLKEVRICNTICKDTEERQNAARELARKVDAMFIIGGKNSANTKRLREVSSSVLKKSYLIETEKDLKKDWLKSCHVIGITSGASTPHWVISKVVKKIKQERGCGLNG